MKVKVSYTMDLEEIPNLLASLIGDCHEILQQQLHTLKKAGHNSERMIEDIDSVRKDLSLVDSKLEDYEQLATGYHNTLHATSLAEGLEPTVPHEEPAGQDSHEG